MGGTSTDVCAIVGGEARREHEREVDGLPVRLPTLAVHTVGAGGGSIVMATHSFGRELAVADRIAILAGGAIALDTPRGALSADDVQRLYALHTEDAC